MIEKFGCPTALEPLLGLRPSYNLLRVFYTSILNQKTEHKQLIASFLDAVYKEKVQVKSYTKRTLIMLAWKYGNAKNYFKLLPLELVTQILSYEEIDEPAYYDMLIFFMKHSGLVDDVMKWHDNHVMVFLPFMCRHPHYFNAKIRVKFLQKISNAPSKYFKNKQFGVWFQRICSSDRIKQRFRQVDLDVSLSSMTQYCLESPTEEALSLLKFNLKNKITRKERLLTKYQFKVNHIYPAAVGLQSTVDIYQR